MLFTRKLTFSLHVGFVGNGYMTDAPRIATGAKLSGLFTECHIFSADRGLTAAEHTPLGCHSRAGVA